MKVLIVDDSSFITLFCRQALLKEGYEVVGEAYAGEEAVEKAWPHLSSPDRAIRYAARIAIEHQPVETWADKALTESDPKKQVEALLALARVTGVCPQHRTDSTPPIDTQMRDKLLAAVLAKRLGRRR